MFDKVHILYRILNLRKKYLFYVDYLDLFSICIYLEAGQLPLNLVLYTKLLFQKHLYSFKRHLLNSL